MRSLTRAHAVEPGGAVAVNNPDPQVRAIVEQMARCDYMIGCHMDGIKLNRQRLAQLRAKLERIEGEK